MCAAGSMDGAEPHAGEGSDRAADGVLHQRRPGALARRDGGGCKVFKADTAFLCLANGQPGKYNGVSRTIVPLANNEGRIYVKIVAQAASRGLAWCRVK